MAWLWSTKISILTCQKAVESNWSNAKTLSQIGRDKEFDLTFDDIMIAPQHSVE